MGSMFVRLMMFGWIPAVLALFALFPARRAVIISFLIAWLFLPMASFKLGGLPDYTKMSATCLGVLMGAALFDTDRLLLFRPRLADLPMMLFCVAPFFSSYMNDLGPYDGVSASVRQFITWGLPYLIGRIYFTDLPALRELAIGIFIGGLIYIPLCWWEIRMSPQLHLQLYGFRQHGFDQTKRDGGFRPMVFMQHGLMVSMWLSLTSMVGYALWRSKSLKSVWEIPMWALVPPLMFTVLLCKSKYAILLLMMGVGVLTATKWMKLRVFALILVLIPATFMTLRASGVVKGDALVKYAAQMFGPERAQSLEFRFMNENVLAEKALQQPWFGWGGWGRARVLNEKGKDATTDSLWIITLGNTGIVGLSLLTLALLTPLMLFIKDYKPVMWSHPMVAPTAALAILCGLYMCDHLMNGMINPIFMLAAGAVVAAHYNRWISAPVTAMSEIRAQQQKRMQMMGRPATATYGRVA